MDMGRSPFWTTVFRLLFLTTPHRLWGSSGDGFGYGSVEEVVIRTRSPFQGSKVANLSPALAEELRLDSSAEGVVIIDVADNSLAKNFGFLRGDRILTVNNDRIARTRDLERISGQQQRLWRITIERGGKQLSVVLGG